MATRTSRKGGAASASHTPVATTPSTSRTGAAQRSPSPLSPIRVSRNEEKKSIQNLNDRLAMYIDAVRARDVEINNLKQERSSIEETHTVEITQVKNMYTKEMTQLRRALDQVSKDKAKLEIEAEKAGREAREAKAELANKEKLYNSADKELKSVQAKYAEALSRVNNAEAELKTLRPECSKLKEKLEDAKRNLEDETLQRIDLQNQLMSLEEKSRFENQMLEKQLNETRVRREIEVSETDSRLSADYERRLEENLGKLRDTYEEKMAENQKEFARLYEDKMAALRANLEAERSNIAGSLQEVREYKTRYEGLNTRNNELESINASLQKRIADLLKEMDVKAGDYRSDLAKKDAEIRMKEEQLDANTKEVQKLLEIKTTLDMEIAVYRNLLEGEEARLGLSQPSTPMVAGTPGRGIKRKRTIIEEEDVTEMVSDHTSKGTVVIEPVEKGAKAIRITNNSKETVNLAGWSLSNTSGDSESSYKFPRGLNLGPEESCTVWSSDSQQEHNPPSTAVMKKGGWVIGAENKTILVNKEGEEEACRMSREEHRVGGSYLSGSGLLRAREDGDTSKCSVM